MTNTRAAIVLGASGSVGQALIDELVRRGTFNPVVTLVRRSQPQRVAQARDAGVVLREVIVSPMEPDALERATAEALRALDGDADAFSVLGIGAGTAKLTIDEHRAVDVRLNAA
ncbi:MAG TPA: saccharopine dehydrogenase NADP-binding domain-containing protein, partial [Polyangia bacterium]|nr:saccharopine dehydrogenase NADP-binding domain-containing protein [Polyangia bacterium]